MYNFQSLDNNEIFYFTDSLNAPTEYIEFLEELDKNELSHPYIEKWKIWKASNDESYIYGEQKNINNFIFSDNEELNKKILYLINSIKESLYMCVKSYCLSKNIKNYEIKKDFAINKYYLNKEMGPHTDSYKENFDKSFTILVYINDNYIGGEIEFPEQNIKIKPEAGSVLIFPTYSPFLHQSHKVIEGKKYFAISEFLQK